jgi:hypothetical protein
MRKKSWMRVAAPILAAGLFVSGCVRKEAETGVVA